MGEGGCSGPDIRQEVQSDVQGGVLDDYLYSPQLFEGNTPVFEDALDVVGPPRPQMLHLHREADLALLPHLAATFSSSKSYNGRRLHTYRS
jgi:hypothetical protein